MKGKGISFRKEYKNFLNQTVKDAWKLNENTKNKKKN